MVLIPVRCPYCQSNQVTKRGKTKTAKLWIERKHLTIRIRIERLVRKTMCFSKSIELHDIVIGLFVNRYVFGLSV